MTTLDAFLDAMTAEPDDPTHRAIFGDWLEEQGHPLVPWLRSAPDGASAAFLFRPRERVLAPYCWHVLEHRYPVLPLDLPVFRAVAKGGGRVFYMIRGASVEGGECELSTHYPGPIHGDLVARLKPEDSFGYYMSATEPDLLHPEVAIHLANVPGVEGWQGAWVTLKVSLMSFPAP